jgi:hypothetical protein
MKTMKFLAYATFVLFLGVAVSSCKGDDGADGQDGATGPAGPAGQDGQDGNANVQTYVYNSPSWGATTSVVDIDMAGILTDDILENDVLLSYVKHENLDMVSAIPGAVWTGTGGYRNYPVFYGNSVSSDPGIYTFRMVSLEMDGTFTPHANLKPVDWVKIIIIESTNTTTASGNGKAVSPQQAVYNELEEAGVDVNDYYEVCAYYGIDPK